MEAYRIASTGVLNTNVEHTTDASVDLKVKIGKGVLSVASKLPFVGSIFSMIDSAVDTVYSKYKEAKFNNRVNSINKIISENGTANT
jgi:hypothetical protein